ncbi:MAG: YkoF family thiamine/hydroxymethylpyrimidine-binding protein [Moorellaceae bacterium]
MLACQVSLYPLGLTNYSEFIKEALEALSAHRVQVEVNSMSTVIRGEEEEVWQAVRSLFTAGSKAGEVVMVMTLSNRCGCR